MRYILAQGVEEGECYYFEVDQDGTAYRQVTVLGDQVLVSIAPHFHVAESAVEWYEGDQEISAESFNEVWTRAVEPYKDAWQRSKAHYAIGVQVQGIIRMFYPQGVIIQLDEECYAVANDASLRKQTNPAHMYPGFVIEGTIGGCDEANFWLVLDRCTVVGPAES